MPQPKYILALDQGTTSSRAIVFGHEGQIVSLAQQEFEQIYPSPGQVEHDPEAIWSSQLAVAREALQRANLTARDLAAIGITNQRETTILWERSTGRPVANAIVWQSRVSAPICDRLKSEGLENLFRERTGLVLDAYFSGTKIKHLQGRSDFRQRPDPPIVPVLSLSRGTASRLPLAGPLRSQCRNGQRRSGSCAP